MCSAIGSRTVPSRRSARGHIASSLADGARIAAGEQRDIVAESHQLLGEPGNDALGAAVQFRWDGLGQRCNLRDTHESRLLVNAVAGQRTNPGTVRGSARVNVAGVDARNVVGGRQPSFCHSTSGNIFCNDKRTPNASQRYGMDRLSAYAKRPIAFLLRYVRRRPLVACRDPRGRDRRRRLLGELAVRREVPGRRAVGQRRPRARIWLAFALLVSLIAADNLLWRARRLDHEPCLRRRHRRPARRTLPSSDGPCAELFRPALGGNADGPHHGDVECRIRGGESFHLERPAALRWRRCAPSAYLAIVSVPMAAALTAIAGRRHAAAVPAGRRRGTPASRLRQSARPGSKANWPM